MNKMISKLKVASIASVTSLLGNFVYAGLEVNGKIIDPKNPVEIPVIIITAVLSLIVVGLLIYRIVAKKIEKKNIWKSVLVALIEIVVIFTLGRLIVVATTPAGGVL